MTNASGSGNDSGKQVSPSWEACVRGFAFIMLRYGSALLVCHYAQVARLCQYMGHMHTNNQAEYAGMIAGLQVRPKHQPLQSSMAEGSGAML